MKHQNDWTQLQRGDNVLLSAAGLARSWATIEDFAEDRSVVWVRVGDLNERKLLVPTDGVKIYGG
jgi:hypothetical protein